MQIRLTATLSALFFFLAMPLFASAQNPPVVGTADELVEAIQNGEGHILIDGEIVLDAVFNGSALPTPPVPADSTTNALMLEGLNGAVLRSAGGNGRLARLSDTFNRLTLLNLEVRGFQANENGGAVYADGFSRLLVERVQFLNNSAGGHGGAVAAGSGGYLELRDVTMRDNTAGASGGAVAIIELDPSKIAEALIFNARIEDNAAAEGCAISTTPGARAGLNVSSSLITGDCSGAQIKLEHASGYSRIYGSSVIADGVALDTDISDNSNPNAALNARPLIAYSALVNLSGDVACELSHSVRGAIDSASNDQGCFPNDAEGIVIETAESLYRLEDGKFIGQSALAQTGLVQEQFFGGAWWQRLCLHSGANGLGRPQGRDNEGAPQCAIGAIAVQQGPNLTAAYSGAYFDPERAGEGYFVEMLGNGLAWVSFFTYRFAEGISAELSEGPEWYIGLGEVRGNSIVIDKLEDPRDGRFGVAEDAAAARIDDGGALTLVFDGCAVNDDSPAVANFQTSNVGGSAARAQERYDQLTNMVRLTSPVPCDGDQPNAYAGLSGNFYDPTRNGQGIGVQWLNPDQATLIWYTFTPSGEKQWLTADTVTVDGTSLTAQMVYPATPTGFGPDFDGDEIDLLPWGTVTLDYNDCNSVTLSYESNVDGYGSGTLDYSRLSQLDGTSCDVLPVD